VTKAPNPVHFHLGCQTITWDKERVEKRNHTVRAVAAAGYEGVEIGARFLDLDAAEAFKRVLDESNISLIAIHTGWNPFLAPGPSSGGDEIERIIAFAQVTETPFLVMSGKDDEAQVGALTDELNAIGERCKRHGMVLCYHNHWWEIRDGGRVLAEIERRTDPDLVSFCPDIGWVRKATPDVIPMLRIVESRIRLVHFKDYVADGLEPRDNETEFGRGIMDFDAAFAFLRQLPLDDLWVVAEQWKSSENHLPPEESIRCNLKFLETLTADRR